MFKWFVHKHCRIADKGRIGMAEIVKVGDYDASNLASIAFHFGKKGDDAPVLALLEQGADPKYS